MVTFLFLYPKFLLFLFLIPIFILVYFFGFIYNKKKSIIFPNFEAIQRISEVEIFSKNYIALYLNVIMLGFVILALSGMSVSFSAKTSSFSFVLAIDDSVSMTSNDLLPSRLAAAKSAASRFVDLLPTGVEIGVISFSGEAVIINGLESSKLNVKMAMDSINYGDVSGTNVYNALIAANRILTDRKFKSVIIVSDGQINVGDAPQIINYANKYNIMISTIAIGTELGGITALNSTSKVDIDFLKSLAFNTGGNFFQGDNIDNLDESFGAIADRTEKTVEINISNYLLLATVILFCITWILYNFRFRIVP